MAVFATLTAIVAAVGTGLAVGGSIAAFSWTAAAIAFGGSLLLSAASYLLAPKPNAGGLTSYGDGDFTRQFRQSTASRSYVYGECRVSGAIAFIGSTDDDKYLHLVIMLADHEVENIGEIVINDVSIPEDDIDSNGFVIDGLYEDKVRIKKHLGAIDQSADSDLVSEVAEWTDLHTLNGVAYIYARLEFDRDVFTGGIPNISAYIKGKKLLDPRDDVTRYSANMGLITRDYLADARIGFSVDDDKFEFVDDTANLCDEIQAVEDREFDIDSASSSDNTITVADQDTLFLQTGDQVYFSGSNMPSPITTSDTYYVIAYQRQDTPRLKVATSLANAMAGTAISLTSAGSGTDRRVIKKGEPRYYGGGIIKSDVEIGRNLQEIVSGMGGRVIAAGGKYRILGGKYYAPTYSFTEQDIVSTVSVTTKKSKTERFNRIKGIYTSQINQGNPSDYPIVENALYKTEDGEYIDRDLTLPFTQRPSTAQRIAKMELERQRQEIVVSASFNLKAFKVMAGDNVYFSFEKYGWSEKVFEILEWSLGFEGGDDLSPPVPVVNITMQENDSSVYDWNNGEETRVDPAPNTTLPSPFNVLPLEGFSLNSLLVGTQNGDKTYKILASWDVHPNILVSSGGFYEIEYKLANETIYKSAGKVDGSVTEMEIAQLQPDVSYDLRIRAFNNLRVSSPYINIYGFVVGDSATTDNEDWEFNIEDRDQSDWEADTATAENWE